MIIDGGTDRRGSLRRRFQRDDLEPHSCPWLTGGGELTRGRQRRLRENVAGGGWRGGRERPGRVGNIAGLNIYNRPVFGVPGLCHPPPTTRRSFLSRSYPLAYITHVRVLTRLFSSSLIQCLAGPHTYPTEAQAQASSFRGQSVGVPYS